MSKEYIVSLNKTDADYLYEISCAVGGNPNIGHPRHTFDLIREQLYLQGINKKVDKTIAIRATNSSLTINAIYIERADDSNQNIKRTM